MATEEYQLGYEAGYQNGWNAAQQPQAEKHASWCASRSMLMSNPPQSRPCDCKPHHKTAPQQADAVPPSWPTNAMIEAGRKAAASHGPLLGNGQSLWHIFRDMYAAAPQQAEAVQACGHPMSLLLRSAESNEPLYCEACDDKSGRHDAERRETELLDANRRLQEKIGSADALKLHAIEELCQLGYTVKDGELFPPDHLHKLMEAANHPLCGKQTEAVPSSALNPDESDSVTLWAEIWRLREAVKGPDGYATWQDAATAERIRRMRAESKQAEAVPSDVVRDAERWQWMWSRAHNVSFSYASGPYETTTVTKLQFNSLKAAIDAAIAAQGAKT